MTSSINGSLWKRPLFIDFDSYTDSDQSFKGELIDHMVENLLELVTAYHSSIDQKDPTLFLSVCHKVKTTLVMLADKELDAAVETLAKTVGDEAKGSPLEKLVKEIISSLLAERG
jgi:hypothetical protein